MRIRHQVEDLAASLRKEAVAPGVQLRWKALMLAAAEVLDGHLRGDKIATTVQERDAAMAAVEAKRVAEAEAITGVSLVSLADSLAGWPGVGPWPAPFASDVLQGTIGYRAPDHAVMGLHEDVLEASAPGANTQEFHNAPAGVARPDLPFAGQHLRSARTGREVARPVMGGGKNPMTAGKKPFGGSEVRPEENQYGA
jgi:hypothetical protein